MGRRFQSGHTIVFPVPTILNGQDGGPRTVLVVGKANTSAYQPILYTRSSSAHGWWVEIDTTGGLHVNYGTGTTARNVGAAGTAGAEIWVSWKDNGGTFNPFGRRFSGASFATDGGDVNSGLTLIDGPAIDTSWGLAWGRWGNTGTDYAADLELYFAAIWNSVVSSATIAAAAKTKAGILALSPDYWASFEGTGTPTDSAGGTPVITGTTTVADPAGFFAAGGGITKALPVATRSVAVPTIAGRKTRAVPVATRTVATPAMPGKKVRALPPAARLAAAVPVAGRKSKALPAATRTVVVPATPGRKTRALTPATRTVALPAAPGAKRRPLPVALRTAVAGIFGTPEGGLIQALPVAVRTAVAAAFAGRKTAELPPATRYGRAVMLGGGTPEGSGVMILGDVMDELAARLRLAPTLAGRTYAYPPASVKAPAAIVTYPEEWTFDSTYGRGMDRMKGEVVVVVGRPHERQSRDRLTRYVNGAGPESVKALLDGDPGSYESCHSVRVEGAEMDVVVIGGVEYLAAVFSVDIAGQGAK